ncbi:hypothetical protein JS532_10850 [Bifidobacterium callimiconis]|uniref:hypothetical protein n=1 Tax=Bifidobacterium callimiconis TaxID=2306973 RepID=UPI001BDD03B8|nr:hypothetical protein [Bifidobacterium callimiconis]MBT1178040.1 hypothetical protein [Bifidobacterium callimiconis]
MSLIFLKYYVSRREVCLYALTIFLIASSCFAAGWKYLNGEFARWSFLTIAGREGTVFGILILGVLGGWLGAIHDEHNVVVGRSAFCGCSRVFLPRALILAFVAILGFVIGFLPLWFHAASHASWGGADLLSLLSSCVILCCAAVCSLSIGVMLSTRWAMILVPLMLVVVLLTPVIANQTILVNTGLSSLQAAPIWLNDFPTLGWGVTAQTSLMRIALYGLLSIATIRCACRRLDGGRIGSDLIAWLCAVLSIAIVVFSIVNPAPLVKRDAARLLCTTVTNDADLCLHPADASIRDVVSRAMRKTLSVAPAPERLSVIEGDSESRLDLPDNERSTIYLAFDGTATKNEIREVVITSLAYKLSGQESCPVNAQSVDDDIRRDDIVRALESSIAFRSGGTRIPVGMDEESGEAVYSEFQNRFDRLSDDEFTQWYEKHVSMIGECSLSEAVLP